MESADLLIVGGGQSGLSTAHTATRIGLRPIILEASDEAVGSWPAYYDSLALFSPARYSALPDRPFPGDPERYPSRDEVIGYLREYAAALDADIRTGHRVDSVTRQPDGTLCATTAHGDFRAPIVIAATGGFGNPYRPALPGLDTFAGHVLHAAQYRNPKDFADHRVVVVGGGNSAVQIAVDLADVARVSLATRGPLKWFRQRTLGKDLHWWLTRTGLDTAPLSRVLGGQTMAVIDDGRYKSALATGNPDHRPMFTTLAEDTVTWSDGTTEHLDTVILATGYRPHLNYLHNLGALDPDGKPQHKHGISTAVPGLGYVGLEWQRSLSSASLRGAARDAGYVLKRLRGTG
ncbi:NAD(P)-binding domain-containing protein [Yinghuangia sp. ASG 101]|uniref:flavin-containing monooxygenase n=1 Tax=Yinghuangia sp. ASG 101 TaxID=2896848 RepID=UPI001E594083|nr:NAD(P)/FAD-dependent oxidoreductase [Yinghuangia sp. ASG 101]UGQ10467.1 NAD(P)-binding domain-containing protein [Yinghuangia sp. ASG 101]